MTQKKKSSRHGKRAPGKTQTSITIDVLILERARAAAERENRSFSNWLECLVLENLTKAGAMKVAEEKDESASAEGEQRDDE